MSKPYTHSLGVSSFSCQQDLAKLRECLGSTDNGSEVGYSVTNTKSDSYAETDPRFRDDHTYTNDRSHSRITAARSIEDPSLITETSLRQDDYLKDHSLEAALVTNEMYQEALGEAIIRLEMALSQNLERQECVQHDLDHLTTESAKSTNSKNKVKMKHWMVLTAPHLKDLQGFPMPENSDAKERSERTEVSPFLSHPLRWTKHEKAVLHSAVRANCQKNLMKPLLQRKDIFCSKLKVSGITEEEKADIAAKLELISSEINSIKNLSESQLMDQPSGTLDWMQISTIELNGFHSPESCEQMWCNYLHPSIYKGSWTEEEDNRLIEIVRNHNCRDWDVIAMELGGKRTAEQCIKRYNGHLNPEMVQTGFWSEFENEILRQAIERHQVGNTIPWNKVSSYLDGRQPHLVRQHWMSALSDDKKKGQWSIEEDALLLIGVKKYGMIFQKISKLLPGRTPTQCRERYLYSLNMQVNFDKWTIEEDRKLISLTKEIGTKWVCLAEHLPGRTANMIRQRHILLLKNVPDAYQRIEYDSSQWPFVPSHANLNSITRRTKVYEYVKQRAEVLNNVPSDKSPRKKQTIRLYNTGKSPLKENTTEESETDLNYDLNRELQDPAHFNFLIDEAKSVLQQAEKKRVTQRVKQLKLARPYHAVDRELDALLLPSIVCKQSGFKKLLALSSKESLEFNVVKEALLNMFDVQVPLECEEDKNASSLFRNDDMEENSQEPEFDGSDQTIDFQILHNTSGTNSSVKLKNTELQKEKFSARNEIVTLGVMSTLSKQCIGERFLRKSQGETSKPGILPPTRHSVDAFKLMVMDRPRVAEIASQVEDDSLIETITTATSNFEPKCPKCLAASGQTNAPSSSTEGYSSVTENQGLKDMDISLEIVSEANGKCEGCARLARLHSHYIKLKNRFISLFFWPGQLFLTCPPESSLEPNTHSVVYIPSPPKRGRKRKRGLSKKKSIPEEIPNLPEKKKRKPRSFKYKNTAPVRSSARTTSKNAI